jgi:hypothetical protein
MKTKKRQRSGKAFHVKNDILHALLNSEYKHLRPKLEQVDLKRGDIIYLSGRSTHRPRLLSGNSRSGDD